MRSALIPSVLLVLMLASPSWPSVPDSLVPKEGSLFSLSDPQSPARLGKALMIAGTVSTLAGGIVVLAEFSIRATEEVRCDAGRADACEMAERERSMAGPILLVGGLSCLAIGTVVSAIFRDDSGRDRTYFGSRRPGRWEAGIRHSF